MEAKPSRKSYRAKFTYAPTDPKGVSLSPGDRVTDVVDVGSGWVVCYNRSTDSTGVCPRDYLQKDMATRIRSLSLSKFRNRVSSVTFNITHNAGPDMKKHLTPIEQFTDEKISPGRNPPTAHVPVSPGQRFLQILVGLVGGAVLGGLLFLALLYLYSFTLNEAAGISGAITLVMGLGIIFSQHVRCVALLMGVSVFTNQGRVALLSLVPGLILTGPIMNMHRNINEGVNSIACVGQVLYNHSNALQQNALDFLVRQQEVLEEGERKINEGISNLTVDIFPGSSTNTTKTVGGNTRETTRHTRRTSQILLSTAPGQTHAPTVSPPTTIQQSSTHRLPRSTSTLKQETRSMTTTSTVTRTPGTSATSSSRLATTTSTPSLTPTLLPGVMTSTKSPAVSSSEETTRKGRTVTGVSPSQDTRGQSTSNPPGTLKPATYISTNLPSLPSIGTTSRITTTGTISTGSTTQFVSTKRYTLPVREPRDIVYHVEKRDTSKNLECVERLQRMRGKCMETADKSKLECEDSANKTKLIGVIPCKSTCNLLSSDVLCSHLNDTVCTSSRRTARSIAESPQVALKEKLKRELGFRVNISRALDINTNNSFNPAEQILEVKKKIQNGMDNVIQVFSLINKILIIFIIWAFISACFYLRKYLKKDSYDNVYITSGFKNLNSKLRSVERRKAVLPLEKKEKKKYVDSTSAKPGRAEAFAWKIGITRVIFHIIIAAFFILLDFALFYVLELISQNGGSDVLVSGGAALDVDLEGVGPLAEFVRNIYAGITASNKFQNVLNFEQCLPSASKPAWKRVYTIVALYVTTLLFVVFQSFGLRLRRKITAFFFPQRESERIHYLYRHILLKRRVRDEEKKKLDLLNDEWSPFLDSSGHEETTRV